MARPSSKQYVSDSHILGVSIATVRAGDQVKSVTLKDASFVNNSE